MKRFVFASMFVLAFMGFAAATVSAAGPAKPVIEGEMPDCYMSIGVTVLSCSLMPVCPTAVR